MAKKPWMVFSSLVAVTSMIAAPVAGVAADTDGAKAFTTTTPIKHVVVIFQENVSFDHYFGTYPYAKNPKGEPQFQAAPNTPTVNGLNNELLTDNPNAANPQRLDRSQAVTDDMDHDYTAEQKAFDGGLMDKFVEETGSGSWPTKGQDPGVVMDYYDGNTVTGMWNYAQQFAMNDNSFGTTFGPSTPGALNLISGQTHGAVAYSGNVAASGVTQLKPDANGVIISGKLNSNGTLYSDADPYYDNTSKGNTVAMTGKNVGDLLNSKGVSWGWFEGGFRPAGTHSNIGGVSSTDYIPHHEPFQYYQSTSNPNHLAPSSVSMIGQTDQANHQYDMTDFWSAADAGNMPAVSFLKAPAYQDGHAGYSDPLDEQQFLVSTINHLEKLPSWKDTAVVISYDDSDGWYDHVMAPIVNKSNDPNVDALTNGAAGTPKDGAYLDRAGYGPRLPLMVISPYARSNYVDHHLTDQSSILRFVEDNWGLGRLGDQSFDAKAGSIENMFDFKNGPVNHALFLDTTTGQQSFADVSDSDPDSQYIADLFAKNLISGMGDGNYAPQGTMTREQFARMIVSALGLPTDHSTMPFKDVKDEWAKGSVAAAFHAGLISGTSSTSFGPTDSISREAATAIVWRYLSQHGVSASTDAGSYDATDATPYAQPAVANAMALGLRAGGASHNPYHSKDALTRADAAALIDLALQHLQS